MIKYIMISMFFILGCIVSDGIGQERYGGRKEFEQKRKEFNQIDKSFEQRKRVAEQVRDYRRKVVPMKQGSFPERTVNPRMDNGFYLKPHQRPEYYRHGGIHPNVGYRPVITWLPEGAITGVRGYVTPDRRRVIIGGNFGFYGISGVNTFNFRTGAYR